MSFILSGYATFLLVKYITSNIEAAFISGLIFMFCPYHFAHALGHLSLLNIEWIPFYVLFLLKTLKESKIKDAIYALIFLFLTAMSSIYYLCYLFIFTLFYAIYRIWSGLGARNILKSISLIIIPFGVAYSPFLYLMLKELIQAKSNYVYMGGFLEYSADLLAFFTPSIFHPIFKDLLLQFTTKYYVYYAESIVFAGYTVLLLTILAVLKIKINDVKFWALSSLVFFILCLGPVLHVNGDYKFPFMGHSILIPLPYAVLMHIPIFSIMHVPSRWDIMLMLSLSVLSGYGCKYIFNYVDKIHNTRKKNILFILICSMVLFEYLSVPYPITSSANVPSFYEQIGNEKKDYAILELGNVAFNSKYMYYQTIHNKKLINGYVARASEPTFAFMTYTPFISQLMHTIEPNFSATEDILSQNYTDIGQSILNYYNIKYIILHKDALSEEQFDRAKLILQSSIKDDPADYENGTMLVYEAGKGQEKPFMALDKGWYGPENWNGVSTRWMSNDSKIIIYSGRNGEGILSFQAFSFYRPRVLEVYNGDILVDKKSIPASFDNFTLINIPISIKTEANTIRLHTQEGCDEPCDTIKNQDCRCLGLAVQGIKFSLASKIVDDY